MATTPTQVRESGKSHDVSEPLIISRSHSPQVHTGGVFVITETQTTPPGHTSPQD